MRLLPLLLLSGCALNTFTVPQPYFSTREPDTAWTRAVAATQKHCGGVRDANQESGVILGPWIAWNTGDGLILTQCLVTLLRGDEHLRDVRVSFSARKCPLSDMDQDLATLAPTCELLETVNEQVKNGLETTGRAMEADITR